MKPIEEKVLSVEEKIKYFQDKYGDRIGKSWFIYVSQLNTDKYGIPIVQDVTIHQRDYFSSAFYGTGDNRKPKWKLAPKVEAPLEAKKVAKKPTSKTVE